MWDKEVDDFLSLTGCDIEIDAHAYGEVRFILPDLTIIHLGEGHSLDDLKAYYQAWRDGYVG